MSNYQAFNRRSPEALSQKHLISSDSNTAESFTKITCVTGMISNLRRLYLFNQFSFSVTKETYKNEDGQYVYCF